MLESNSSNRWQSYYDLTGYRLPRETLVRALNSFDLLQLGPQPFAVDLGCGSGRDTIEMLRRGWQVLAIDSEEIAIKELRHRHAVLGKGHLTTKIARFEESPWGKAALVNSGFALPFCEKFKFLTMWDRIVSSLKSGGRFSGQLFGDRDDWVRDPSITHLTLKEVRNLLSILEVEWFFEEETFGETPRGKKKRWHIFHIVARKD